MKLKNTHHNEQVPDFYKVGSKQTATVIKSHTPTYLRISEILVLLIYLQVPYNSKLPLQYYFIDLHTLFKPN